MVDPVTLSLISLSATAAGGGVGALGSIFGGQANAKAYQYQAAVAQMNAGIAKQNAAYEMEVGEMQQVNEGLKIRAQISQTKATQGASGLDLNSGSGAAVRASERELGQYDQSMIRYNAARRAYGDDISALGYTTQAGLDTMAASTSQTAGYLGAASSILGAAGSFSSKWTQGQQVGIGGSTPVSTNVVAGGLY